MVASTTSPLSHLTRNMALGSASWTTPSNSSLSPLGSLRSRRSLMKSKVSLALLRVAGLTVPDALGRERCEDARGDLLYTSYAIDSTQNAQPLVIGEKLRGHRLVSVEAPPDDLLAIVRPVVKIRTRGGRVVLQVVNLSSAFVGTPQYCSLDQQL